MDESDDISTHQNPVVTTPHCRRIRSELHHVVCATPGGLKSPAVRIPPTPFLKRLGYGTGVDVFLYERSPARNGKSNSPWALKRVRKTDSKAPENAVSRRLEAEAAILKRLRHPNIIGYRGFKTTERGKILVMEDGEISLMDLIEERREDALEPYPARKIEKVLLSVAKALDYLHTDVRLLHGDLKSGNVLIKNDFDDVKLCDFGVTVNLDENLMANGGEVYVGTDLWSAPEVLNDEAFGSKADIFSLGLIVYEMLALEMPHCHVESEDSLYNSSHTDSLTSITDSDCDDSLLCKPSSGEVPVADVSLGAPDISDKYGTRPELPADFVYDDSYKDVLQVFVACTEADPKIRPSAKTIVDLLSE